MGDQALRVFQKDYERYIPKRLPRNKGSLTLSTSSLPRFAGDVIRPSRSTVLFTDLTISSYKLILPINFAERRCPSFCNIILQAPTHTAISCPIIYLHIQLLRFCSLFSQRLPDQTRYLLPINPPKPSSTKLYMLDQSHVGNERSGLDPSRHVPVTHTITIFTKH